MEMRQLFIALALLGAGTGLGYWLTPTKIVTKTEVRTVTVTERQQTRNNNIVTRREVTHDDKGREVVTETTTDNSVVQTDTQKNAHSTKESLRISQRETLDWQVTALTSATDYKSWDKVTVLLQRRILGEIYAGGWVSAELEAGIGLTIRF